MKEDSTFPYPFFQRFITCARLPSRWQWDQRRWRLSEPETRQSRSVGELSGRDCPHKLRSSPAWTRGTPGVEIINKNIVKLITWYQFDNGNLFLPFFSQIDKLCSSSQLNLNLSKSCYALHHLNFRSAYRNYAAMRIKTHLGNNFFFKTATRACHSKLVKLHNLPSLRMWGFLLRSQSGPG